jgi:hypothetical protein
VGAQSNGGNVSRRPAFYAARPGRWRDWWTLLHPPYTAWHLSYVVIGATIAPHTDGGRLAVTLVAFFLAVGIAAHALDELHGRPLRTGIPSGVLVVVSIVALAGALLCGFAGIATVGWGLLVFIAVGPVLVLGYNLELFNGWIHTDVGFAAAWGSFPVLVSYYVQAQRLGVAAALAAIAAFELSLAQRTLSTPARVLRRRVTAVSGTATTNDGEVLALNERTLLAPLEHALAAMSWAIVALALALAYARLR